MFLKRYPRGIIIVLNKEWVTVTLLEMQSIYWKYEYLHRQGAIGWIN